MRASVGCRGCICAAAPPAPLIGSSRGGSAHECVPKRKRRDPVLSGIAGVIRFDGGPVEPGRVETMTSCMAYRGPDGVSHWRVGSVALGQCMTRTTLESLEETQPLANEDESLVLVLDGWLSNWEELRAEILAKGGKLRTRADAELVLRSYEIWGEDCLDRLEGDFAFVIWDARQRRAFCARDRIRRRNRSFIFGTAKRSYSLPSRMRFWRFPAFRNSSTKAWPPNLSPATGSRGTKPFGAELCVFAPLIKCGSTRRARALRNTGAPITGEPCPTSRKRTSSNIIATCCAIKFAAMRAVMLRSPAKSAAVSIPRRSLP